MFMEIVNIGKVKLDNLKILDYDLVIEVIII